MGVIWGLALGTTIGVIKLIKGDRVIWGYFRGRYRGY